jgi:large subunit ribosomal protein L29
MNKINTIKKEFKELSLEDLMSKVDGLQRELFSLRLHSATSPVKDQAQFKKLRKDIARALTYLQQKKASHG